ncbi:MAG: DNA repair exonuclease [Dehalococcoidales bacterium]|nr:DNA repair exonuclease [Dehalococcoidales bacterium]
MAINLLHTADVHLDAPFRWLGDKGREQRRQLKETFRAVVDLALAERVDALLIAGDLFDSNSPAQDTVELVRSQLARLAVPVFILPGTHDCLDDGSVYRRTALAAEGARVHLFDGERTAFTLSALGLTVHGRANLTKTSPTSPLAGLARNPATPYNVCLAHGSLAMPGTEDDFPLTAAEVAAAGMDYLALGHWHSYRDCSTGRAKACYSGPPELLGEDELGCPILIELGEGPAVVTPRPVGRRRYEKASLPLDGVASAEEVRAEIRRRADPELVLAVALGGLRRLDVIVDADELMEELGADFFALRVVDDSRAMLSPEEVEALSPRTVAGQFARRMSALIAEAATPAEQRRRESALQIGLALLQGRRVLR